MATKKRRVVLSEDAKRSKKARLLRKLRDGVGQYLEPQDEGYRELVSSAYNKFRLIPSHQTPLSLHSRVQLSLSCLLSSGYFMHNLVTKETKILLTPVTRFITGIRGLTYPYLGLRLFAFPWEFEGDPKSDVEKSLCVLRVLNDYMELKGNELCGERGANEFNMTLVNYMDPDHVTIPLVTEPYYAMGTSAVHWHSDQSVRDDCSIGVYSSTVGESNESEPWSIGLKIAWDVTTSAVKVPLLNGSCYFLLNDMNTTHQHTVIVGDNARFSSTHRVVVLDGNTLEYISGRCRQAEMIAKRLNGEGSVCCQDKLEECLDVQREVEFEWIRQFWSLGRLNAERHAGFWLREIERIEQTWERVESAVKTLYDNLLERGDTKSYEDKQSQSRSVAGTMCCAKIILQHLERRADERQQWTKRYNSSVLRYLADNDQPIKRPSFPCRHPHFSYDQTEAMDALKSILNKP